jgi:hypothetical protein
LITLLVKAGLMKEKSLSTVATFVDLSYLKKAIG